MIRTPRGVATLIGVGLLTGLILGLLLSLTRGSSVASTSSILVQDDATALQGPIPSQNAAAPTETEAFVSGEIALLASDAFRDSLRSATRDNTASIKATQVGTSNTVQLTSNGSSASNAEHNLTKAISLYTEDRKRRVEPGLQAALNTTASRLTALRSGARGTDTSSELSRLLSQQSDLLARRANLSRMVPIISPVTVQQAQGMSTKILYPLFGALIGGILAGGVCAASRQRDTSRTALSTLTMRGRRVLAPVLDLTNAVSWPQSIPVILAQLPPSNADAPLILVDAEGSGSADTVSSIIQEVAPFGDTMKVGEGRHSGELSATAVARDRDELVNGAAGCVVIVADSEYTTAGDVDLLSDDLRSRGITPGGVLFVTRAK